MEWKIITFLVATNIVASQQPERRPTGMPTARAKNIFGNPQLHLTKTGDVTDIFWTQHRTSLHNTGTSVQRHILRQHAYYNHSVQRTDSTQYKKR